MTGGGGVPAGGAGRSGAEGRATTGHEALDMGTAYYYCSETLRAQPMERRKCDRIRIVRVRDPCNSARQRVVDRLITGNR